jgi:hypothetical protein
VVVRVVVIEIIAAGKESFEISSGAVDEIGKASRSCLFRGLAGLALW